MKKVILLLLLGVFLLSGCTSTRNEFKVTINTINDPDKNLESKRYILVSDMADVDQNNLQYKEFSAYVNKALENMGYVHAKSKSDANIVIKLKYGVNKPQSHNYSYSSPVYGQTGVSSSTTTYEGNSSTTSYTPSYGVVGNEVNSGTVYTYYSYITLSAYDLHGRPLWETTVGYNAYDTNFRFYFPKMIEVSKNYIGENIPGYVNVIIKKDDEGIVVENVAHYDKDWTLLSSERYENYSKNGYSIEYYKDGKVKATGNYKFGGKVGKWIFYDKNGKVKEVKNF